MAEVTLLSEDCCDLCGKHPAIDIDGCEYPHHCSDGIFRWTDGTEVKELKDHPLNGVVVEEYWDGRFSQLNG